MNIKIDYNTISFDSQILCNDEIIQNNLKQTIEDLKNKRITDWFETFISRVKEESNNDVFSIEINGCDLYEKVFIDAVLEKENELLERKKISFEKEEDIIKKYNAIDAFFQYTLNSKEDIVKNAIKPNVKNIGKLRSNKIEVPVVATMSSGKSTLLNALIGQDFLFEDTGTATATTCTIKVNNKLNGFKAQAFNQENLLEETNKDISNFLKSWNLNANDENQAQLKLTVEGPVKELNSSNFELHLIDTPGPNSAKYKNHKDNLFLYFKDNQKLPIVLYVLDPEKMDSKDDDETLNEIRNTLKDNTQNLDRIIFVYNKVDREDLEKKSLSNVLQKIRDFLKNYGIVNPKIFPLSAKYAKLAQLSDNLSRKEKSNLLTYRETFAPDPKDNYCGYQLLEHSPLPNHLKEQLKIDVTTSQLNADLVHSGLAAIKLYIEDYIVNHHQKNLYKDLMGIAFNIFNVIENNVKFEKQSLEEETSKEQKKSRERNQDEKEELNRRKEDALKTIDKLELDKKFILNATKKIDRYFDQLKNKTLQQEKLTPSQANQLVEEINPIISNLRASIKTDLISKMNDVLADYLKSLKSEVVKKFELRNPSLEIKTFNSELLNNINVLDVNSIEDYKRTEVENRQRDVEREVTSTSFFKRIFGFKDTVIVTEHYQVKRTVIDASKFYSDIINPKSRQFREIVNEFRSEFENISGGYNDSFKNLVNFSFEEALNAVYENTRKKLNLDLREKEIQIIKLNKIERFINEFKIHEYNEKIYRKSALFS